MPASNKKKKIVVGLSGGVSSLASAILLKLQSFDVYGVTVDYWNESKLEPLEDLRKISEKTHWLAEKCNQLGIQYYIRKSQFDFEEVIFEDYLASRFQGLHCSIDSLIDRFVIKEVYQAMKKLKVSLFSTGHICDIHINDKPCGNKYAGMVYSRDSIGEQNFALGHLSTEELKSLRLPLKDLQRKDIIKIAKKFDLFSPWSEEESRQGIGDELKQIKFFSNHVNEENSISGKVINLSLNGLIESEHRGMHFHFQQKSHNLLGYDNIEQLEEAKDPIVCGLLPDTGDVLVTQKGSSNQIISLGVKVIKSSNIVWVGPFSGYIYLESSKKFVKTKAFPRQFPFISVEIEDKLPFVLQGESCLLVMRYKDNYEVVGYSEVLSQKLRVDDQFYEGSDFAEDSEKAIDSSDSSSKKSSLEDSSFHF